MFGLEGRVAIVTGGGSGIGRAAAIRFCSEGVRVVVADLDSAGGRDTVGQIEADKGQALFLETNIADEEQVERLVGKTVARYGQLDIAFNNAGIGTVGVTVADHSAAIFDQTIAVNLRGVFLCMKYEIKQMLAQGRGGCIVNTSSAAGVKANAGTGAYTASKFAVNGLTRVAAIEYAPHGIRVNALMPGIVDTPLVQRVVPEELREMTKRAAPMQRFGKPEEMAAAVAWLCSNEAAFVTGATMPIDGGLVA